MNTPQSSVTPTETSSDASELAAGVRHCLLTGKVPDLSPALTVNEDTLAIFDYLRTMQKSLTIMAQGLYSPAVPLRGYTGGILKSLQSDFRHLIWKAQQIAAGDFSQQIDFMGEMSEAFNTMARELEKAHTSLEDQKRHLARLSENLRQEIDARIMVEQDLRREERRMRKLASIDPLTGIANRRYFFQLAAREIDRSRRSGQSCCLAMTDLDHFKTLNDTYGHKFGDKALRRVAKFISNSIRAYDLAGRYGGDEFILLFPGTEIPEARATLERLSRAIAGSDISPPDMAPPVSISCGLTRILVEGDGDAPIDEAIARADKALYIAKQQGRGCIVEA